MRITTSSVLSAPVLAVLVLTVVQPGCGSGPGEVAELREQNRQILARLDSLEKKVGEIARPAPQQAARRGPDPDQVYTIPVGSSPVRGPESAPITIVEFSDYQCPFCARSEPLIAEVLQKYGDRVRFVYKHFPLTSIHPQALPAARAAVAAQKQGKFWEMHELLFKNQRALGADKLKGYATQIGLDPARFDGDANSPETQELVQEDSRLAQQLGVRGTPTIFVNGRLLRNRSLPGFTETIDSLLTAKAGG